MEKKDINSNLIENILADNLIIILMKEILTLKQGHVCFVLLTF